MFELFWHHVYVRAKSRTLTPCLRSSGVENLFYVRTFLTPCLRSSGVENPALLDTMFMFERSREPCATCLCSSGVENLPDTKFMFERSREPCATFLPVYVRAFLTPCLRSSGVENLALLVYVRAESRTFFMFEPFWNPVYVRAESRTLLYLFTFERSREPWATWLLVYVRAESRTFLLGRRSREPPFE